MKTSLFAALIAVCLVQSTLTLSCNKGFYDNGVHPKCQRCADPYTECTSTSGTVNSRIKGYNMNAAGTQVIAWCAGGTYNDAKGTC